MSTIAAPVRAGTTGYLRPISMIVAIATVVFIYPTSSQATNGMFANGYGAPSKGQAGAGITHGEGPLAAAQNPALGVDVGNVAGLCFTGFMPHRDVDVSTGGNLTPGKVESENEFFPIVCGGANYMVNNDVSVGVVAFGNGGMNTEYKKNPFAGFGAGTVPLGMDMAQAFIALNGAYRVSDNFRVGAAPVLALMQFKAYGLEAFRTSSASPDHLTGNGYDKTHGGGFKVGANYDVNNWLTLGVTYQSRMYMQPLDKYAGLFAEHGDFDIPAFVGEGIGIKPHEDWTIQLEHQRIFYSDVKAIGNSHAYTPFNLGSDNGAGFGWNDMDIFRLGVEHQTTEQLKLRAGVSYATDFADDAQVLFNILAPATPKVHAAVGMTYSINPAWAITGSYAHAFSNSLTGRNPSMTPTQDTKLRMDQDEFALGFSYRF